MVQPGMPLPNLYRCNKVLVTQKKKGRATLQDFETQERLLLDLFYCADSSVLSLICVRYTVVLPASLSQSHPKLILKYCAPHPRSGLGQGKDESEIDSRSNFRTCLHSNVKGNTLQQKETRAG